MRRNLIDHRQIMISTVSHGSDCPHRQCLRASSRVPSAIHVLPCAWERLRRARPTTAVRPWTNCRRPEVIRCADPVEIHEPRSELLLTICSGRRKIPSRPGPHL